MKRRVIAIDCDDVIVGSAESTLAYYNRQYGTHIELKDFYSNDLAIWGVEDDATAIARVEAYHATDEYKRLPPFREAIEVMGLLAKYHELHIVTGRNDKLAEATHDMLAEHFPGLIKSVEFTNFFGKTARSKSEVCKEIGADLLIDDHLHHASVVAAEGIDVLLFGNYPWNQADELPPRIQRVRDWHEIAQLLLPPAQAESQTLPNTTKAV